MSKAGLWFTTCLILLPLLTFGQSAEKKEKSPSPGEKVDKLFDFWNRLDQPGFAVVVVKEGHVVYQKTYGLACQEHGVAITPKTVFNIATVAQPFVGMAVAMLEQQGKLSLEDDVRKYIPEIPDFGIPVKLRHLLYQTSGLRDWLSVLRLSGQDKEEITFEQVRKILKAQKKLAFSPGERFQESNTNYDLLAEIIKRISGHSFSGWTWENIFKPLKMTRTQFRDNCRSIFDDQAFSYNYTRQEYLKGIDNLSLTGSHSLFATLDDLAKWLLNLETGQVGGKELFARMFTAGRLNNGQSAGFGYGLKVDARPGRWQVSQTGAWAGSGAVLVYYPDQKFGFVVLANWDYTPVSGFIQDIIDIYFPAAVAPVKKSAPPAAQKKIKVKPEKLDSYAGDYRFGAGQVYSFSRSGDQLIMSVQGMKLPLTPLSETEFLLDIANAKVTFQKNSAGKVQHLVWEQGGERIIAKNVVLVKPIAKELQEYAGVYVNEELGLRYAVELHGDELLVNTPGQNEIRMTPDEKDTFSTSVRALPMVIFLRDAQKRLTGLIIDSDPVRDLVFKKIN